MDNYSSALTGTIAPDIATMETLLSMADQVSAAATDVEEAWRTFCFGKNASPPSLQPEPPPPENRFEYSRESLSRSVTRLRQMADNIRSRA